MQRLSNSWRKRRLEAGGKGVAPAVLSLAVSCLSRLHLDKTDTWNESYVCFRSCLQHLNTAHHRLRQTHSPPKRTHNRVRGGKRIIISKSPQGSISLTAAQTPEEFSICMINIEQKLHMDGKRLVTGATVEMRGVPDATVPR